MRLFQVVRTVLDELYAQIPLATEEAKDEAIRNEIVSLRKQYRELMSTGRVDYSKATTRFAYVYSYVTAHAYATYWLIKSTSDLNCLFDTSKPSVCCLGGGPGSELLGMLKFVSTTNKTATLMCRVYDRQEQWRNSMSSVCNKLSSFNIFPTFRTLDVAKAEAWTKYSEIRQDNLFTLSFFMSEVYSKQEQAENFFRNLFRNAKTDSFFLFVDNRLGYASK